MQNINSTNFTIVSGTQSVNKSQKGLKQVNENVKKMNQRSQSVLKSHTEFNHGFVNN